MGSIKTNEMIEKFRRADFKGFGKNKTFSSWIICIKSLFSEVVEDSWVLSLPLRAASLH